MASPPALSASAVVKAYGLQPHPEGGFYAETFRDTSFMLGRESLPDTYKVGRMSISTAIYFLVPAGNVSKLHRFPSAEIWHFYYGEPLTVLEIDDSGNMKKTVLGNDILAGQKLQHVVPGGVWFGSFPTLDIEDETSEKIIRNSRDPEKSFSLVGCTVAPGFEFKDLEMASFSTLSEKFPQHKAYIELMAEK